MNIKRQKVDNRIERQIITGLIISDEYCKQIIPVFDPDYLEMSFCRIVAGWCTDYFAQYTKAPGQHIEDIFHAESRRGIDPDLADLIEDFLADLSEDYEDEGEHFNVAYLVDKTIERFKRQRLIALKDDIEADVSRGDFDEAEAKVAGFKKVAKETSPAINPYDDQEQLHLAFTADTESLFTMPGALGEFLNEHLVRESLVAFMGPEKIGKTWLLDELAYRAGKARCSIASFQAGDLSQSQAIRRRHVRLAGKSWLKQYCGEYLLPVLDCKLNQSDTCSMRERTNKCGLFDELEEEQLEEALENPKESFSSVTKGYNPCTFCHKNKIRDTERNRSMFRGTVWYEMRDTGKPLTWREALRGGKQYMKRLRGKFNKLLCRPTGTLTVADIETQLKLWEDLEGFVPDVILVDYADILLAENTRLDPRHQHESIWAALRKLSLKYHCLVLTVTQADAKSYSARSLKKENFSEDKRKYAHVTAIFSLNQMEHEKEAGVLRIGPLLQREGEMKKEVTVLQCLRIGRAMLDSFWT